MSQSPSNKKEPVFDIEKFKLGFQLLDDTTKAPIGALRVMRNAQVTDKGGLGPRPGVTLIGESNTNGNPLRGLFNFRKSFGQDELLVKAYDDELEVMSKNLFNLDGTKWFRLKNGFTPGQEFGFATSLVNTDQEDYVVFSNKYDPYQRWTGAVTALNGALVGGETAITVDSTLFPDIFEAQTATANSASSVTVADQTWADDQWNTFYILFTSGTYAGSVKLITDVTGGDTITFDALGAGPGNVTFEIRRIAFPASGTLIYNGTNIDYTAIMTSTSFTVASANAAPDRTAVTYIPEEFTGAPRGNRITNYLNRMIVANVRSALARGIGGALQGFASAGSYFVSEINDHTDFSYSAARVAGEGDVVSTPYGGGDQTDVQVQEDSFYVFKPRYIEGVQYTQDVNDTVNRTPLKAGTGSIGKTIKGSDDVYFITADKKFTSLGRVKSKDLKPETENIGTKIKTFLDRCNMDDIGRGIEIKDKIYIPVKSNADVAYNDILIVYNKNGASENGFFEGIWEIPAFAIEQWNDKYVFAESNGPNVYEMLTADKADIVGETRYPIISEVATHFMNLSSSKSTIQALHGLFIEGYIRPGTTVVYNVWKSFETTPFLTFKFVVDVDGFLDGEESSVFLGGNPLALEPLSTIIDNPDADGRRHFSFRIYFPFTYANYFSFGQYSDTADADYETTRFGLILAEDPVVDINRIKGV